MRTDPVANARVGRKQAQMQSCRRIRNKPRPRRRGLVSLCWALTVLICGALCWGWRESKPDPTPDPIAFEDIAARAGVQFVLRNSATPEKHQIETMVSGVAVFEYNNDGKPDLYFVNGALQPKLEKTGALFYNRLYRNNGDGTFTDLTLHAGVQGEGFSTGVTVGDSKTSSLPASIAISSFAIAATAHLQT